LNRIRCTPYTTASPLLRGVGRAGKLDAFQIRVGNASAEIGRRNEVKENALCVFSLGVSTDVDGGGGGTQFYCGQSQTGRYVSVEHVDPVYYSQMKLCNVDILYH